MDWKALMAYLDEGYGAMRESATLRLMSDVVSRMALNLRWGKSVRCVVVF